MGACPELDLLERFTTRSLDAASSVAISAHVAACAECGARISDVRANLEASPAIRRALGNSGRLVMRPVVDGFRILREIGRGGMGVVYEAEQTHPQRLVALKLLDRFAASGESLRRFEHEARALARLHHPGIAQVYAAGSFDGPSGPLPYFAMELVRGRALRRFASETGLDVRGRLLLLAEICDAVEHAHQKGVIHRDLKPGNVVMDESDAGHAPQPKVLDFGVARLVDAQAATIHTEVGQIVGTLPYASPEQLSGDPQAVDTRSDVYSLGVIGYELLTGRLPIAMRPDNVPDAIRRLIDSPPVPPGQVDRRLRGDVETIILHAIEKEPSRRYSSAAALATDLRRLLNHETILARPPSAAYQLARFARRNRGLVGVSALALLGLVGATAFSTWQAVRARRAERLAQASTGDARREAEKFAAVNAFLQEMLASVSPENRPGEPDVTVRAALNAAAARLDAGALAGKPEIEVPIRTTIGNTFRGLGDYRAARGHLARAVELAAARWPEGHEDRAFAIHKLARTVEQEGDLAEAERLNRAALEMRRALLGGEHADVGTSMNNLGVVLLHRGKLDESEALLRESLVLRRRLHGDRSSEVATGLNNLALVLRKSGKPCEAAGLFRESLAIDRALRGEHPNVAITLGNLGTVLTELGEYGEAEPHLRGALEMSRRIYGEEHPHVAAALNNLALLLIEMGDLGEAELLLRRSMEMERRFRGDQHWLAALRARNLANVLMRQSRYEEAEALLAEARRIQARTFGNDHRENLSLILLAGDLRRRQDRLAEAEASFERAIAIGRAALPPDHWLLGVARVRLGECQIRRGSRDEARANLLAGYEVLEATLGAQHPHARGAARSLAELFDTSGEESEAARWRGVASGEGGP